MNTQQAWTGNIHDAPAVADWIEDNLSQSHRGVVLLNGKVVLYEHASRSDIAQETAKLDWRYLRSVPGMVITDFVVRGATWVIIALPRQGTLDVELIRTALWENWEKATNRVLPGFDTQRQRAIQERVALETEQEALAVKVGCCEPLVARPA